MTGMLKHVQYRSAESVSEIQKYTEATKGKAEEWKDKEEANSVDVDDFNRNMASDDEKMKISIVSEEHLKTAKILKIKLKGDEQDGTTKSGIRFVRMLQTEDEDAVYQFRGDNFFLSNTYMSKGQVILDGTSYNSVENAFQAAKLPHIIRHCYANEKANPKKMKRFWRPPWINIEGDSWSSKAFEKDKQLWELDMNPEDVRVMEELIFQKFYYNDELRRLLLATGNKQLYEGNDFQDTKWGVKLLAAKDRVYAEGNNLTGKLIMSARDKCVKIDKLYKILFHPFLVGTARDERDAGLETPPKAAPASVESPAFSYRGFKEHWKARLIDGAE